MTARLFTVLAAVFLVLAVALAALAPVGMTLDQGLQVVSDTLDPWLRGHSPAWLLDWVELPLLARPLWLAPAALGVVCAGFAASCSFGTASPSRQRRS